MRNHYMYPMFIAMVLVLLFSSGRAEPNIQSSWMANNAPGARLGPDWTGCRIYSLEERNLSLGIQNDKNDLYIMLRPTDRETQAQIMRAGLTLWLDGSGKKKKNIGIHFPLGMQGRGKRPPEDRSAAREPGEFRKRFSEMPDTLEIIGPKEKERTRVSAVNNGLGLSAMAIDSIGVITYLFKIPLRGSNDTPYAVAAKAGGSMSFGIETGEVLRQMGDKPRRNGSMPRGGGGRPEGGGPRGGPGGFDGRGTRGPSNPPGGRDGAPNFEPIKFWAKVTLAVEEAR